jgi:hypothetical protein
VKCRSVRSNWARTRPAIMAPVMETPRVNDDVIEGSEVDIAGEKRRELGDAWDQKTFMEFRGQI